MEMEPMIHCTINRCFVYFGYFPLDNTATKIGKTTNLYNRSCTYNTSHPLEDFNYYFIIEVDEEFYGLLEQICLDEYDNVKARQSPEYNHRNHDNEWITIRPTREEIESRLGGTNIPFEYKILSQEEISEEAKVISKTEEKHLKEKEMKREKLREQVRQLQNERRKVCNKEPLSHHIPILEQMPNHFKINDIGHIIEPCGSGKSFLSIYYTKTAGYKTIVIGTPSVYLQTQMHGEILEVMSEAIIRFVGGNNETPIDTIKEELRNVKETPLFVITTYASCRKLVGLQFDMKIGDECHHLTGIDRENKGYLRFHDISSNKSLFMTATKKMVDTANGNIVFSMDDEEKFGKCIDEKSVKWAIDNKVITDYKVIVLKAPGNTIADIIDELDITLDDKTIEIFISAYMTLKSIDSYDDLSHVLCYTNTTAHAELMQKFIDILLDKDIFQSLDKKKFYNKALHCDSRCILKDEVAIMKNKKHGIISCVYIFGEGFNLPKLNGVCFAENMVSIIRIIQCALRSARIEIGNPNKISYLLVPFIDHDDFNEDNASHKKVRSIVSNLGNVDENIGERLVVNTLTKRKRRKEQDSDTGPAKEKEDEAYDFGNDDLELRRLRLRLRRSKDLKSKRSMEEEEYLFHKALLKENNIKSKREYDDFVDEDKEDDIERYFKKKGVWHDKGWYDLLSIDTSMYPSSKGEWKRVCQEKNIKSIADYKMYCERENDLPLEPDKLYKDWNSSIETELGISRPRRR